jgi:excisionase family DNA binding protein
VSTTIETERATGQRRFETLRQAEQRTGLSGETVRRWGHEGRLRLYRVSARKLLVDADELDRVIVGSATAAAV